MTKILQGSMALTVVAERKALYAKGNRISKLTELDKLGVIAMLIDLPWQQIIKVHFLF